MKPTSAQHHAIHTHDRNLIVMAGAGSGKTRVLVERYLMLLREHDDWPLNALVAITFTQKAAQEMRDRVRKALQDALSAAKDERTQTLWAGRIAAMDSARIDTIHALCASILRANAAEAQIDPGFSVLDETEAKLLLNDAIDAALRDLDAEARLFREYDAQAIRKAVQIFAKQDAVPLPADALAGWRSQWEQHAAECLARLLSEPEYQDGWQPAAFVPTGDKLAEVWQACEAHMPALRLSDNLASRIETLNRLAAAIELRGGSEKAWGDKETLKAAKDALKAKRELAKAALEEIGEPPGELDERAAELLPLWQALIERVRTAYRAAKADRAALDFDDLEQETRRLLRNPEVATRYRGAEFKHVLVDEFQDTNAAQWEIVKAVADPAIPGCLFVVGDAKQSIYQFRGADVSVFDAVQGEITGAGGHKIDMARSFRTHKPLVEAFNYVFNHVLQRDEASPVRVYQIALDAPMEAERADMPSDAPPIELLLLPKPEKGDGEKVDRRAWEARELAARIKHIVEEEKRPVFDKEERRLRPMRYGDVALLFQAMTHSTLYEDALKAAGLPYVSIAGRGYFDRQEVWDLLNLLKALYNPSDNLALAAALRSPLFNLSDEALLALRFERKDRLWDALGEATLPAYRAAFWEEVDVIAFAHETLRELRTLAGRVTIHELLTEALERTGYLAVLSGLPDGARRRGNVEKLLDKARTSGKTTLGAFSVYLDDLRATEAREGEAMLDSTDAIRLMTVHKSKGLEFPLVVLVDASFTRGSGGAKDALIYDGAAGWACTVYDEGKQVAPFAYRQAERLQAGREEAEKRRLLYVAATRAQDYLLISGAVDTKDGAVKATGWLSWLIEAFDLADSALDAAQVLEQPWGKLAITCPQVVLPPLPLPDPETAAEISTDEVFAPPLLAPLPVDPRTTLRSLTATQIMQMGSALHGTPADTRPIYREQWRRSVLGDAPARIDRTMIPQDRISDTKIGEIVHEAIRDNLPDNRAALAYLLDCRAWEQGIVTPEARAEAVSRAYGLLQKVRQSDVFTWIGEATQVLREVPFIYETGRRAIHGQIDLLIQRSDGTWAVIDYKTSYVGGIALAEHARQYIPQVGVYAAAVSALLGSIPQVYIHYIRYQKTVRIAEADWRAALARLEDDIGSLLG